MSDDGEKAGKDARSQQPSHLAYQVSEGREGKSYFNRIGAAFEHKDKDGFNIQLDSLPVDGRVTLRALRERLRPAGGEQEAGRDNGEHER